jgi:hypothetical protein
MFHYGEMDCITRGQLYVPQYNLFGALHHNLVNGQDLIDDAQQCVEGWLDGVAPLHGSVSVQDLLQDLSIRDEAFPLADELFK